jgi:hypothetical protein
LQSHLIGDFGADVSQNPAGVIGNYDSLQIAVVENPTFEESTELIARLLPIDWNNSRKSKS